MAIRTVRKIIEDRGGQAAVAEALSAPGRRVHKQTVHSWIVAGKLPWWREDAVMALPKVPKRPRRAKLAAQQAAA